MRMSAGLSRRTIGAGSLWTFAVAASSPMTVIAGGVVATYTTTGVTGVPLSFLILTVTLGLLTVGYVAMARHIPHAATTYALVAKGLGPAAAVAAAAVALVGYNTIEIGLFGLLGWSLAATAGGVWWVWAGGAWLLVAILGPLRVRLSVNVVLGLLVLELAIIAAMDLAAFTHPAAGSVSIAPLSPAALFVNGAGGVFALGMAAFTGYETGPIFAEEARGQHAVSRSTFAALGFLGLFYAVSSWAMAVGVDDVTDPEAGLPFSILVGAYGATVSWLATGLLMTSMFGAMLSFHGAVARHLFALGRARVAPAWLARTGTGSLSGAPVAGSVAQSVLAGAAIITYAALDLDPLTALFTWLSTVGAVAILGLLVVTSIAAVRYFARGRGGQENAWTRRVAPTLGILLGGSVLLGAVLNLDSLLGQPPGSLRVYLVPGAILAAAVTGLFWAWHLRAIRPGIYTTIGDDAPHPLTVIDERIRYIKV